MVVRVLFTALLSILVGTRDARASTSFVLVCGTQEAAATASSPAGFITPKLTYNFGTTYGFYQEKDTLRILGKKASAFNATFTVEAETQIATGTLVATIQSTSEGLVLYRDGSGNVLGSLIDVSTRAVRTVSSPIIQADEADTGVGAFYLTNLGFTVWGTSATKGVLRVYRQSSGFSTSPSFDVVFVNITGSVNALASAVDPAGTVLFIVSASGTLKGAVLSPLGDSFFNHAFVKLSNPVPAVANAQFVAMGSNAQGNFMALTVVSRSGVMAIQSLFTFDSGTSWEPSLEVGSFAPNPSARSLISMVYTDRWVVVLNAVDGHRMLQMTQTYPFEFDWRAAFQKASLLSLTDNVFTRRSVALLPVRTTRMLILGTEGDGISNGTLSSLFCALQGSSVIQMPSFVVQFTIACLSGLLVTL